jgi:glucose-6-phosphate isomerase
MTSARVSLDLSLSLAPRVTRGVSAEALRCHPRVAGAAPAVQARVAAGELGFWGLPDDTVHAALVAAKAQAFRARFDRLVVFGIGGSSLGGRMLNEGLAKDPSRVVFVDNVDPVRFEAVMASLDLERTCFNVISKSGGTVETAAQFVTMRQRLREALGERAYQERVLATTDAKQGLMREIALADGLDMLPVPDNVGGRFSILTAVGLFPSAFAGLDVGELLAGAAAMRARCESSDVQTNPALAHAALHHLADTTGGQGLHVVMPYCDRLRPFGEWYCQLWGESLGKAKNRAGLDVHVGPTPIMALGATDQHSQIQLYAEGPFDKVVTFVRLEQHEEDVAFPDAPPPAYGYLRGHSMRGLIDAEQRGTQLALARLGRPSLTLSVARLDERALGELIFFYEASTAFAGELYDVDAFDQPGVEMGKKIAFALMGREGFDDALKGLEGLKDPDPAWVFRG